MKGKLKYLTLLLLGITLMPILKVSASNYNAQFNDKYKWIPNNYVNMKQGTRTKYQQMAVIARTSDNQFVYCIEPGTPLEEFTDYTGTDVNQAYVANMSQEQWKRIQLLAFYGYGYSDSEVNHSDLKWYAITQFMIWQTVPHGWDIYFTDSLKGNRITKYESEMAEMERLVANHYKAPEFGNTNFETVIGNTIKITDTNSVLSKWQVSSDSKVSLNKSGNDLYITANEVGSTNIALTKKDIKYSHPTIVYVRADSQDLVQVGSYDPLQRNISINIVGGKVAINKVDRDTGKNIPQGDATLAGAVYGVYSEDGTLVTKITTDKNGYAISGYLPSLGKFYLKEITPSKGYELDTNSYEFNISKDNLEPLIPVQEKVIERNVNFFKVYANDKTGMLVGEPNVIFDIYLKSSGEKYKTITTDSKGYATVKLPYGTYIIKQVTATTDYEKVDDFEITINENTDEPLYKLISNAPITAKLKVIKVDKDTGDIIARANIKFKIFNVDTGEYVCQRITYPTVKKVCEFETDENGILITPYPLMPGTYRLEEVDQRIDGYLWNKESVEFHIGENSELIKDDELGVLFEVKFANKEVKGGVTIDKTGEKFVIDNGKYTYDKVNLANVKIGLYAKEDIYSANGKLIYKKGELVKEGFTNKDDKLVFDNLYLGKYFIKEIATDNNHVLDDKEYELELKYKNQYTDNISYDITLKNYYKKGKLEFTKKDLVSGDTIPNTIIEIYNDKDELIGTYKTDKDGKVSIDDLAIGKYYIIEKEATTGYVITDEKVYFEIKDDGEIIKAEMKNKPLMGSLEFTKVDFSTGEVLPDTLIEIYNENNELVFSGRTNEEGKIVINELRYGKYYILEKEAPEGYELNDEKMWFEITEDGQIVKSKMKDHKKVIEVPNTLSESYLNLIAGTIVLTGAGLIIIANRRKKNK